MQGSRVAGDDDDLSEVCDLAWQDSSGLQLGFGESVSVSIVYTCRNGSPAKDVVDFALVGQAQDASLDALSDETDDDGVATVELHASSIAASFRLRASAPLAAEMFLDVSVSDSGFGDLRVNVVYVGSRAPETREARVFTDLACGELDPLALPADDRSMPIPQASDTVTFANLAAGPSYTAVTTGSADDAIVAFGCVSGLEVTDGRTTETEVLMDDLSPSPIGEYDVRSELDLADAVRGRPNEWLDATRVVLEENGGAAGYVLARISDYVEASYDTEAASRFDAAAGTTREDLETALSAPERDPGLLLGSIGEELEAALETPVVYSRLTIDPVPDGYNALHELHTMEVAGEVFDLAEDASLSFASLSIVSRGNVPVTVLDGAIDIDSHELAFPVGSLAAGLAEQVVPAAGGAEDLPDLIARTLDCADIASLLVDAGADADCNAKCLDRACHEASLHLASSIMDSLRTGDDDLARLVVGGRADLRDEGGDLRAELLTGLWLGTIAPSEAEIGGSFVGTRVEDAR